MNVATDSPFFEFVLCGKLGALELGISRAETIARLGAPKDWFGKPPCFGLQVLEPNQADGWFYYDGGAAIKFGASGTSSQVLAYPQNINRDLYPFKTWPVGPGSTIGDFVQFLAQNGIPFHEEPDDQYATHEILAGERCYALSEFNDFGRLPPRDRRIFAISYESDLERPKKRGGPEFFGWGKGSEITKPLSRFTRDALEAAGWTKEKLLEIADAYREISRLTPENAAASPRAQQLEALAGLFK